MALAIIVAMLMLLVVMETRDYRRRPLCRWCNVRHRGRCVWNPRANGIWANTNDGHFDFNDPNK